MISNIQNQYIATLKMLRDCISEYDKELWLDDSRGNAAWQIAYHAVFFANIYASPTEKDIKHWEEETENYEILGTTPWPPHEKIKLEKTYSKEQILSFLEHVIDSIPGYLENMEPEAKCWAWWYELNQLEFQMSSLRHIQHHVGQLIERHRQVKNIPVKWETMQGSK